MIQDTLIHPPHRQLQTTTKSPNYEIDDQLIKQILKVKPRKFAYVSCGMASLARNLRRLTSVYHVDYIQPIDMMPQTARCEAVVKLSLRNGNK